MSKKILLTLLTIWSNTLFAYDKPNSIAWDPITKAYFISNLVGKSITKLDSNFDKTDIITGLIKPKDLLFATFGPYKGILVLDSNEVKVYDADSYSFINSFEVPGAIDLEDAEADKTTSGTFYISDPLAHIIFKVVIGPPPFYTPSFSTLTNTVRNPKALLFDSKNRLLVTTDTLKSAIYYINTSTGNASFITTTSLDYINSLEEDLQGNYYATSWGDSYFYRLDRNFGNPVGLVQYSKPTGLFFNKLYDVIAIACSNCNKVDFHKLHMVYINDVDTAKCPGDSFYINPNLQFKGKGTYNTGNTFYAELSDGNGKFNSPLIIGTYKTATEPNSYQVVLPYGKRFYGSKYKIRIRSSSPAFYSLNEIETPVPYIPLIYVSDKDTIYYCSSNSIKLGKAKDTDSSLLTYLWYMDEKLQSYKTSQIEINETGLHKYKLTVQPKIWGCTASDSVFTEQKNGFISIPFKDSVIVCQRADATIGGDSIANTSIRWTDKSDVNFLHTTYKFEISGTMTYGNRTFTATLKSTLFGCEISKDVKLIYKNNPKYKLELPLNPGFCANTTLALTPQYVSGDTQNIAFNWGPKDFLSNPVIKNPVYKNTENINKITSYNVFTKDTMTKCTDSFLVIIKNLKMPEKPVISQASQVSDSIVIKNYDPNFEYNYEVKYLDNSVITNLTGDSIIRYPNFKKAVYVIVVAQNKQCISVSDTLFLIHSTITIKRIENSEIVIYPNPAKDKVLIKDFKGNPENFDVFIYDLVGQKVSEMKPKSNGEINIENLLPGIYSLRVNFEGQIFNTLFIKK